MGFIGLFNHLFNFAMPAIVLAVLLPLLLRWTSIGRAAKAGLRWQMLTLTWVNLTVLAAGLLWFGHDGKMATYLTMAAASASTTWLLLRGWRR